MPRFSAPGATYMVTRTTANSLFLLAPCSVTNGIFEYCLARAAKQFGVLIHAVSVGSDHYHMVVTDIRGELSSFMQELNRTIARCLTQYLKQRCKRRIDTVWTTSQSFSAQLLVDRQVIIKKIAYVLTNPVKDGLVRNYRKWPGFNTRPGQWLQGEHTAQRPAYYFKVSASRPRVARALFFAQSLSHGEFIGVAQASGRMACEWVERGAVLRGQGVHGEEHVALVEPAGPGSQSWAAPFDNFV